MTNTAAVPHNDTLANQTISPMTSLSNGPVVMPDYAKVVVSIAYIGVVVVAVGGNLLVCGIVVTQKRMRTVTNYFLFSLACSDLLMATLCIPFTFIANVLLVQHWPFGRAMCPIMSYSQTATVFLSAFTMLSICVDRYRAVIFPLKPKLTTRQTLVIIFIIWVLALLVSLPTAIFSRVVQGPDREGEVREFCDEDWPDLEQRYAYSLSVMVLQYFVPLGILAFTYAHIGIVIWVKRAPGEAENNRDQRMAASKRKMVKMMITVVVIYALCWLPIHAITLIGDRHPDIWSFEHIQSVWVACHWLAMSNSCYNPIVYYWMNAKFRNGFRYVFRRCPCVKYDPISANGGTAYSKTSVVLHSSISTSAPTSANVKEGSKLSPYLSGRGDKMLKPFRGGSVGDGNGLCHHRNGSGSDYGEHSPATENYSLKNMGNSIGSGDTNGRTVTGGTRNCYYVNVNDRRSARESKEGEHYNRAAEMDDSD